MIDKQKDLKLFDDFKKDLLKTDMDVNKKINILNRLKMRLKL